MITALVIDDNRQTAAALKSMLAIWDIEARVALGSSPAMTILSEFTPQLVLLDVNMPGVNGFEVLAFLQREPKLANVPVILVTSDDQPETATRALSSGAAAVVIKPAMPDTLEAALRQAAVLR